MFRLSPFPPKRRAQLERMKRYSIAAASTGTIASSVVFAVESYRGNPPQSVVDVVIVAAFIGACAGLLTASNEDKKYQGRHGLIVWMVLPLFALAALLFAVAREVTDGPLQSMVLNLSATAIGALVVVFLVDNVVTARERARWAETDERIAWELSSISGWVMYVLWTIYLQSERSVEDVADESGVAFLPDPIVLKKWLAPANIAFAVEKLTGEERRQFTLRFQELEVRLERYFALYGQRLSPERYRAAWKLGDWIHVVAENQDILDIRERRDFVRFYAVALYEVGSLALTISAEFYRERGY